MDRQSHLSAHQGLSSPCCLVVTPKTTFVSERWFPGLLGRYQGRRCTWVHMGCSWLREPLGDTDPPPAGTAGDGGEGECVAPVSGPLQRPGGFMISREEKQQRG